LVVCCLKTLSMIMSRSLTMRGTRMVKIMIMGAVVMTGDAESKLIEPRFQLNRSVSVNSIKS